MLQYVASVKWGKNGQERVVCNHKTLPGAAEHTKEKNNQIKLAL
jgi:hypothetical protein